MYPIRFENIYFKKIWGGRGFEAFRDNLPYGEIGESWDLSCHPNGYSIVANGKFVGKGINEIINELGHDLVGSKISTEKFPLLVKLINSKEKLSVQVHPNDKYAKSVENDLGKTEAWYVIDAKPGSKLVIGTKNCNKNIFKQAIENNNIESYLNIVEVKTGDCFIINSGLVHSICEGLIIAEIQQNSDITYRVYDYGRSRELHIKKSLDVINFELGSENLSNNKENKFDGFSKIDLCENEYFGIKKINIKSRWMDYSDLERFYVLTCVDGEGEINGVGFNEKIKIGDSYLIPANLGEYIVSGQLSLIKSYPI